jgi:CRISPR-associated protein Csm5
MQNPKETFRCALKIASPVHLGCDDVYEPTGFVVDEEKGRLMAFDPFRFIQDLPENERQELSHLCRKGTIESVLEIYKFFRGKQAGGREVELCNGFVDHYRKVLGLNANAKVVTQNLNQFQIARTAFKSHDNRPYIPGTAVKGAIRTACLNALAGARNIPTPRGRNASRDLQAKLIDYEPWKMETDPFRLVKVSDFMPVGKIRTRIVYAINKKKKVSDREARGPYQILEVIEPGACFVGEIAVEKPQPGGYIRNPATLDGVLRSLNPFFRGENERECRELGKVSIDGLSVYPPSDGHVLRIGRHSGAESITVNGHRNIRIMLGGGKKPVFRDKATTFWLASETDKNKTGRGLRPFGWVVLEPLSPELDRQLCAEEEDFAYQDMLAEKQRLDEMAARRERVIREKRESEWLRREKKEAEQREKKRQAALAAMSPEERDIATLEDSEVIENTVVEVLNRLDDFENDNKIKAAVAIKKYYQDRGKWKVSKKKKKQFEKVKKIKAILGEQKKCMMRCGSKWIISNF